jgi:undecaprenyl-diphosphatase
MEQFLKVTLLAILQGITEFLPVSSSGHLELLSTLFKFKNSDSMTLSIMLHAGSLAAIVVFYFKTLWSLLKKENFRLIGLIILGSVPAGIFGVTLKMTGYDEMLSSSLPVVGFGFLITAALLRLTTKEKPPISWRSVVDDQRYSDIIPSIPQTFLKSYCFFLFIATHN